MASGSIINFMPKVGRIDIEYANIAPGSRALANLYNLINNDMPAGSTCLGIVGYQTGNNDMVINTAAYFSSNYSFSIVNIGAAAVSGTAILRYLYI